MSKKIKTDYVLEVRGVRHHLVKQSDTGCGECSLREVCFDELVGSPCFMLTNGSESHFEKVGDTI